MSTADGKLLLNVEQPQHQITLTEDDELVLSVSSSATESEVMRGHIKLVHDILLAYGPAFTLVFPATGGFDPNYWLMCAGEIVARWSGVRISRLGEATARSVLPANP